MTLRHWALLLLGGINVLIGNLVLGAVAMLMAIVHGDLSHG